MSADASKIDSQEKILSWLYTSRLGTKILPIMIHPAVTKLSGILLDSPISKIAINGFIKSNNIDMSDFEPGPFRSFNAFFTRQVLPGKRPVDQDPMHLVSPCDGWLSAHPIFDDARFMIKNTEYSMQTLLRDEELAERYKGGTLLIFRLTVSDYHRYGYPESGWMADEVNIPGVFNTVNPLANDVRPIYKENTREYTTISTDRFGEVLMMEVGALMVGKIVNYRGAGHVERGEEKGRFEFGGSTIIVCLEQGVATLEPKLEELLKNVDEVHVTYGSHVATATC